MKRRPPDELLELTKPQADQFPIVEGTMCVEVRVPAHLAYVALLQGFVAQMTNHWSYQGAMAHRKAVAALAQEAYVLTDWGSCMNCEELIECITPLLEAQTLQITNNILNQAQYGTQNPGLPLTGEQSAANIAEGTNPGCDLNVLWAQCLAIIEQTNLAIVDVLEKVEVATNVNELAGLIDAIPMLGFIAKAIGTEAVTDTINYFQEAVTEEYIAQFTEGVKIDLACQLFCLCSDDCVLSVDRLCDMLSANVIGIIPDTPSDLLDLIEIVAGVDFDGSEVVNVCFWFAWIGAKVASFFFGESFIQTTFDLLVQLAVNDANNDWTLLCDCPDVWTHVLNSDDLATILEVPDPEVGTISGEVLSTTTGVTSGQDFSGITAMVTFPTVQQILNVTIEATDFANVPGDGVVNHFVALRDSGSANITDIELPDDNGNWTREVTGTWSGVKFVVMQYAYLGLLVTGDMKITITGRGTNPFV